MLFRHIKPVFLSSSRFYAKKSSVTNLANKKNINMKQIHEETLRIINPFAKINIKSDIYLKVKSVDVHAYPNGDAFIVQLHGGHVKNCPAAMNIKVSDDEKQVDLQINRIEENDTFHCEVEVPIRANLNIDCKNGVYVANVYDDELIINAFQNISIKEVRASRLRLSSENGGIKSEGLVLSKDARIETKTKGNITLNKVQGEKLLCRSNEGTITTDACYVDSSKFETHTGNMKLKNVHKRTEVIVHQKGDIQMISVHGNMFLHSGGGNLDLQLSQLDDESIIVAEDSAQAKITISDTIEENTYIEISALDIQLEDSLSHLMDCVSLDKQTFRMSREENNSTKLIASIKGQVHIGKLSWAESMRANMTLNGKE